MQRNDAESSAHPILLMLPMQSLVIGPTWLSELMQVTEQCISMWKNHIAIYPGAQEDASLQRMSQLRKGTYTRQWIKSHLMFIEQVNFRHLQSPLCDFRKYISLPASKTIIFFTRDGLIPYICP